MPLLPLPQPYSFELSTERFRSFGIDLANLWHRGGLHRVVRGREVRIEAAAGPVHASAAVAGSRGRRELPPTSAGDLGVEVEPLDREIEREVRRLLGEPFDLAGFAAWAGRDPVLGPLVERLRGFRPPLAPDPWEMLVGSITAQQVSLFAAFAIRKRFVASFGERAEHAYAFPRRRRVARAREEELVALGFSRRKAEYVLALARSDLDLDGLAALDDGEVRARITGQRGLGDWTADWFLARHLGRPTAWPSGDLGLRKAVAAFYGPVDDVRAFGARFHPFQNLAAHYLLLGLRVP